MHTCVEDWKTTPWRKIDVENMDIECKKFAKEIRMLDKEMRTWDTYTSLEATVKNTLTSLKAVGELQNSAIRERHWNQLMKSTKVKQLSLYYLILQCNLSKHTIMNIFIANVYTYTTSVLHEAFLLSYITNLCVAFLCCTTHYINIYCI